MTRKSWDETFLHLAKELANSRSLDPSTKVGALIAKDNRIVSMGYNGFVSGADDSEHRWADRAYKLRHVCHAERNALDLAEESVRGATLYVTPLPPCHECAKSIAQKGIARVVMSCEQIDNPRWAESWADAQEIFRARGITWEAI